MIKILSGKFKGRILKTPDIKVVRPTTEMVRAAIFNIIQHSTEGSAFLDLFAGFGGVGIEALSRNASVVYFVDNNDISITTIKSHLQLLKIEPNNYKILPFDISVALNKLAKTNTSFDFIYSDPPYSRKSPINYNSIVLELVDTHNLLKENGVLFLEDDIAHTNETFANLQHLYLKNVRSYGNTFLMEYYKK